MSLGRLRGFTRFSMSLGRLRGFTRFSMSLTPPPLRSGSVPAQAFSLPRLFVWGPGPKRHGGSEAAPPNPPRRNDVRLLTTAALA